jgi:hypothetical protein
LHFVGEGGWSDERVFTKVRELVLPAIERQGPIEAWIKWRGGALTPFERGKLGGRPPGMQNKVTRILKDAILLAADRAGMPEEVRDDEGKIIEIRPGPGGLDDFLLYCALNHTKAYMTLLGRGLPLQINTRIEAEPAVVYESVEQVRRIIVERGLDKLLRPDVVVPMKRKS